MSNLPEVVSHQQALAQSPSIMQVIQQIASSPNAKDQIEVMKELLAMQERMEKNEAEKAFNVAFKEMQSELPVIPKRSKNAQGQPYATYEDAMKRLRPIMSKHGFASTVSEEGVNEHGVQFVLWLKHVQGHKEPTRRTFPTDKAATNSSGKAIRPAIQDAGSTTKYAERYLLFQALGLIAEGEDTDGDDAAPISADEVLALGVALDAVKADMPRFLKYMRVTEISQILQRDLPKAYESIEQKRRTGK